MYVFFFYFPVCKATLEEMLIAITKVDPKRTVEIGYHLDAGRNKKTVQLSKSETYLTELMENICEYLDFFFDFLWFFVHKKNYAFLFTLKRR